jgi:pimeloyl-ACP methyl ester carboxylesterase
VVSQVNVAMSKSQTVWLTIFVPLLLLAAAHGAASPLVIDEPPVAIVRIEPPSREAPQLGSVQLKNGMILSGLCSSASTLAPLRINMNPNERFDQKLEMRLVNQRAREIYLPVRTSERPALNNLVWPSLTFTIPQERIKRSPLSSGIPDLGPFDERGIATGKLYKPNGSAEEIQTGIVAINELYADVQCLTHDWNYSVSFDSIPRDKLPEILSRVKGFSEKPFVRLDLVRMLLNADRLPEAQSLFDTVKENFPELAAAQANYLQLIREQQAKQITSVIEQRRDLGQHQLASTAALLHSKDQLVPETIVRVNQLVRFYEDVGQRVDRVKSSLSALVADVDDPAVRDSVNVINRLVAGDINVNTIDRFAAFELIALTEPAGNNGVEQVRAIAGNPERVTAEEQLAMAFSGWLMGADHTSKSLIDVVSLFEARQLLIDYLNTDSSEIELRRDLAGRISKLEGVGIDRVAAIVRNLPACQPPRIEFEHAGACGRFQIAAGDNIMGAMGIVPPEYSEARQYPVVIALHGQFDSAESYLAFWQRQAEKNGYIVISPEWHVAAESAAPASLKIYDASARTHLRFLNLMRTVKHSLRIDDDRIFAAGHDVGGEAAADLVTSHPDLFAGVISICGMGRRHLQWTVPNAILLPWYFVIGDAQGNWFDRMSPLTAKLFKRDDEMRIGYDVVFVKYPYRGLERYTEELQGIFEWMGRQRRVRYPEKVYGRLLRSTDLHWSWVRLAQLPEQFAQLDAPSNPLDGQYRPTELNVRRDEKNFIRIKAAPSDVTLLLSPEIPELDVNSPIKIHTGRKTIVVDYKSDISHLLEELYNTGERSRLCYMRLDVQR